MRARVVTTPLPSLATVAAAACVALLCAQAASAQVIRRERDQTAPDAKKDDEKKDSDKKEADKATGEDDDILAPARPTSKDGDKKPEEKPAEPKAENAVKLGFVALVPVGDASKPTADAVTAALIKELQGSKAFDVVGLAVDVGADAQKSAEAEAAAKAALLDGDDKLKRGKALLSKLQFGKARAAFEQALASFEKAAPVLSDAQPLFFAHVGLAEVAARQGQEDETAAQLGAASILIPELDLDPKDYPPQFIRSHQKVRARVMAEPRGSILVDATATGASVLLDGRDTAGAPARLSEVPAGRHLVRALREGLPGWGTMVDVVAGAEATVSPGFLAKDGSSVVDALGQNRFEAGALDQVKKAAAAAGLKGALVGVVGKDGGAIPVQLLYVDAAGQGVSKLPLVSFQSDLLDVSIESLKARERAEDLAAMTKTPTGTFVATLPSVLDGAKAGAAAHVAEVKMRYEVKAAPVERTRSRVVGAEEKPSDEEGRSVLSGGKSGTRQRMDDEADPYAERKDDSAAIADPDAPITEQPWFLPVVIGAGVGAVVLIGGGTVLALIGLGLLPDPRPADKGEVHVTLP